MSQIRCVYAAEPPFPATDQAPGALRWFAVTGVGVFSAAVWAAQHQGETPDYVIDATGGKPTPAEIAAVINPPAPSPETAAQKVAGRLGLTLSELKAALAAVNGSPPA